jgi:hypothetical protein
MKRLWILFLLVVCFVVWYSVASDYGDAVASGTYHLAENGETSTLVLKTDHSFQQELSEHGELKRAVGTWHRVGEGGITFSKDLLPVSGQELGPNGTAFADMHKNLGFLVFLTLRQYHVLWYGRLDPSTNNTVPGTYTGDENGVQATLILKPDGTFEQTVNHPGITKRATGSWSFNQKGDILFSKAFLKSSGEALRGDETASAWDPKGSNLQIEIIATSTSGPPTYHKRQFF